MELSGDPEDLGLQEESEMSCFFLSCSWFSLDLTVTSQRSSKNQLRVSNRRLTDGALLILAQPSIGTGLRNSLLYYEGAVDLRAILYQLL